MRYFIFDCNNQLIGNPKGYKTMRGARQQKKRLAPLIWERYERKRESGSKDNTLCTILHSENDD